MDIIQLDKKIHKNLKFKKQNNDQHILESKIIKINAIESQYLYKDFPIVISDRQLFIVTNILGKNLYLDKNKKIMNLYIPKILDNLPFYLLDNKTSKKFIGIDIDSDEFGVQGKQLFTKNGNYSKILNDKIKSLETYSSELQDTVKLIELLEKYDLLIDVNLSSKETKKISVNGFKIVDKNKLSKLNDKQKKDFDKNGISQFIYCHLNSLSNFDRFFEN